MSDTSRTIRTTALASAVLTLSVVAACGDRGATADSAAAVDTAAAPTTTAAAAAPAAAPSDAQIAHVAVTANAIDSAAGELARQKGTAREVKDFGQTMVNDHGAVNRQAVALATKLGVTPEDNETSRGLKASADQSMTSLQGMSGAAFDRAYIDNEVTYHQTVLDALDRTLIPNAQNAELKALLQQVRPNIDAHLQRAKSIQASLPK